MSDRKSEQIAIGTWARISGLVPGEEEVFEFVPEPEANLIENKIPLSSPLAKVLEGAKPGDHVIFHPPAGRVELTILEVGRSEIEP